jgi:hypothetical protein
VKCYNTIDLSVRLRIPYNLCAFNLYQHTVLQLPTSFILDGFTRWVHATLAISHSQCVVFFSHNGIVEELGLPEYVASTCKNLDPRANNERSLIDTGRALCQDSNLTQAKSPLSLNLTLSLTGHSHEPSAELRRTWLNLLLANDETIIRLLLKSKHH